jgi:hypothetical protein
MRPHRLVRSLLLVLTLWLAPGAAVAAPAPPPPSGLDARWLGADRLACELAARARDVPMLERCTANLYAAAPRDAKTVELQWALALARGQGREARELVTRARALNLSEDGVWRMQDATEALLPEPRRFPMVLFLVGSVLCLSAVARQIFMRRATPRSMSAGSRRKPGMKSQVGAVIGSVGRGWRTRY